MVIRQEHFMRKKVFFLLLICLTLHFTPGYSQQLELNTGWMFRDNRSTQWLSATVPGSVYKDLMKQGILADPFFADRENDASWVDHTTWEYRCGFTIPEEMRSSHTIKLRFDGLDTYAEVWLNGQLLGKTDNMFHPWSFDITPYVLGNDTVIVRFSPALEVVDRLAAKEKPLRYPDNNRVFARKAAYQFGWDWGPALSGAGIWKPVFISTGEADSAKTKQDISPLLKDIRFHQDSDTFGVSFYFSRSGKPIYVQGANWIPSSIYPGTTADSTYRTLLVSAKEAGVQMMRVWGGGLYEKDLFYDLCDSLGIMVWQDFMFACAMYPGEASFINNVKEEVKYQIGRLAHHPCIVLWCGNNEIDEAWHHWGWQKSYNLHNADSATVWQEYVQLFRDSIPEWIRRYDPDHRPYVTTSPQYGWGNPRSMVAGDSHYWGFWWGLQNWEIFRKKTGRFVSEWGMQALPTYPLLKKYIPLYDGKYLDKDLNAHQKANGGNIKLKHYLNTYFIDTTKLDGLPLELYAYLSNAAQYYLLKNVLLTHQSHYPRNMGSLVWQYNDCWPAISWSITDYDRSPKGGWYALRACRELNTHPMWDKSYPKDLKLNKPNITIEKISATTISVHSDAEAAYVYITDNVHDLFWSDNYFHLAAGETKEISILPFQDKVFFSETLKAISLWDVFNAAGEKKK